MYNEIKTIKDIEFFLDKTNSLHDGYIINVHYANNGISIDGDTYYFNPEQTKLTLQILVTSICDTIIEIEFEYLKEWQIRDNQWDITDTTVFLDKDNWILWSDDVYVNQDELKNNSYVIAKAMKWRVIE
jgi:hypothetical protein